MPSSSSVRLNAMRASGSGCELGKVAEPSRRGPHTLRARACPPDKLTGLVLFEAQLRVGVQLPAGVRVATHAGLRGAASAAAVCRACSTQRRRRGATSGGGGKGGCCRPRLVALPRITSPPESHGPVHIPLVRCRQQAAGAGCQGLQEEEGQQRLLPPGPHAAVQIRRGNARWAVPTVCHATHDAHLTVPRVWRCGAVNPASLADHPGSFPCSEGSAASRPTTSHLPACRPAAAPRGPQWKPWWLRAW